MTTTTRYRYPDAPPGFTAPQIAAWNNLVRIMEQQDRDLLFGNPKLIPVNQLKDGVIMKGFTTVAASTHYAAPEDGTMLVFSSVSGCDVYLTSAVNSNYSVVCVKKMDGNGAANPVIIRDVTSAAIDSGFEVTVSVQNSAVILACDGKQWWVISRYL